MPGDLSVLLKNKELRKPYGLDLIPELALTKKLQNEVNFLEK